MASTNSYSNNNNNKNKNSTTVRFNVGGTIYEVSRSTLDLHPMSLLARMVSPEWNNRGIFEQEEEEEDNGDVGVEKNPIFIERDSERFRYVLDYMRDGSISLLPLTISKEALLKDLHYFGFDEIDESEIEVSPGIQFIALASQFVEKEKNKIRQARETSTREIRRLYAAEYWREKLRARLALGLLRLFRRSLVTFLTFRLSRLAISAGRAGRTGYLGYPPIEQRFGPLLPGLHGLSRNNTSAVLDYKLI